MYQCHQKILDAAKDVPMDLRAEALRAARKQRRADAPVKRLGGSR